MEVKVKMLDVRWVWWCGNEAVDAKDPSIHAVTFADLNRSL